MGENYTCITVETVRDVAVVSLNRPKSLNAINMDMTFELLHYFSNLESGELLGDEPVLRPRVIVLRGTGKAFCAGLDLGGGSTLDRDNDISAFNFQRRIAQIIMVMKRVKQPIIGLVQGPACGGGLALALACDVRLATEDARFNVAMAKIGLTGCDIGISYFLPRLAGPGVAAQMMMTGEFLGAQRAFQLGMVNALYTDQKTLDEQGLALAARMVDTTPPLGLVLTKEGLRHSINAPDLESAIAMEDRQQLLMLKSKDMKTYLQKGFPKKKANL